MATKDFSSVQERKIADFLGWRVVSGSGARDFHPGDIIADEYLGECKTHTSEKSRLHIYSSVWNKISEEANSSFRKPVLFFDNGTQKLNSTWCVFPKKFVSPDTMKLLCKGYVDPKNKNLLYSKNSISFIHKDMQRDVGSGDYIDFEIDGESLLLMDLFTFKHCILGDD